MIEDGQYTKMVTATGVAKYYTGKITDFNPDQWASYNDAGNNYLIKLNPYNKFEFMSLNERCKTYEQIIATGQDAEKAKYKLLLGEECLSVYQKKLNDCNTGKDGRVAQNEGVLTKCRKELKDCVTEFNINTSGRIESAWFGPHNGNHTNTLNVKAILVKLQQNGTNQVTVNTATFGDPAPKVEKFLFINYRTETGEFKKYKIPMNSVFDLRFPNADVRLGQTGGRGQTGGWMTGQPPQQRQNRESVDRPYQRGGAEKISKTISKLHDNSPYCSDWATRNPSECIINEAYMRTTCARSCAEYALANMTHHKKKPVVLGPDPLNDMSEYGLRKHRDFPILMKNYVPIDSCPSIKDYVLKSSVVDVHQKALSLISEIKSLNAVNEKSIHLHPQYKETMNKFALATNTGYSPCQQCPTSNVTNY
jgi:hypothetical protein